jgi:hypothetical protein
MGDKIVRPESRLTNGLPKPTVRVQLYAKRFAQDVGENPN